MRVESIIRKCTVEELRAIAIEIRIAQEQVTDKSKIEVMREISNTIDALPDDAQKLTTMKRMMPAAPNAIAPLLMSALTGGNDEVKEKTPREDETMKLLEALKLSSAQAYRRDLKFT